MPNYMLIHRHDEADCATAFEHLQGNQKLVEDLPVFQDMVTCGCPHGHHWGVLIVEDKDATALQRYADAIGVGTTSVEPTELVPFPLE